MSFGGGQQNNGAYAPQNDYEASQRLKELGNKKGISSEDIFGQKEMKSDELLNKYNQLQGAKAISSDMFFGEQNRKSGKNFGDEVEGYFLGRSSMNSKLIKS